MRHPAQRSDVAVEGAEQEFDRVTAKLHGEVRLLSPSGRLGLQILGVPILLGDDRGDLEKDVRRTEIPGQVERPRTHVETRFAEAEEDGVLDLGIGKMPPPFPEMARGHLSGEIFGG